MISFEEALAKVLACAPLPQTESLPLVHSLGRILAKDISSDRDLPPFDRVAMDGIAICLVEDHPNPSVWEIQATVQAGSAAPPLKGPEFCLEITTGAALPPECHAVIPYEHLQIEGKQAKMLPGHSFKAFQNIHQKGSDKKSGETLVPSGMRINPGTLAIAATVGLDPIEVYRQPSLAIVSTGSELVPIDQTPNPSQIRKSNDLMVASICQAWASPLQCLHCADDYATTLQTLEHAAQQHQVLVTLGGVSKGKYDFVTPAVKALGWTIHFHGVNQKPGKPLLFATKGEKILLGFPGNPAAAFMAAHLYLLPLLKKMSKAAPREPGTAFLSEPYLLKGGRPKFQEALVSIKNGLCIAQVLGSNGSGDLTQFAKANALLYFPKPGEYSTQDTLTYYPID
jgi:molybdopterin molybdotransferase